MGMRRRTLRDERGQSLVEFALVLPILLALLVGAVEFGKAFFYWLDLSHLANTGARAAVVDRWPGCTNTTPPITPCTDQVPVNPNTKCGELNAGVPLQCTLQKYLRQQANTDDITSASTVTICFVGKNPADAAVGDTVRVTVNVPYNFLPFLKDFTKNKLGNVNLRSSATMRLEQQPRRMSGAIRCPGT
jgi:Flp pilus assembly protein TadG